MAVDGRLPDFAMVVYVERVFMHCPKCMVRSKLWQPEAWPDQAGTPSMAEVMVKNAGLEITTPEEVLESCRYEWTMGGRFLVGEYTGDRGRDVFRGREVIGYDSFRQEYRWFWVNNMTTGFTLATGHNDKKTRTLTMEGVQDDIEQGLRDQPFKVVYKYVNDNEMSIEVYKTVGGKLYKRAKVRSVRNNE